MSSYEIKDNKGKASGSLTLANIYEFEGFVFEFHLYLGVSRLRKKDHKPTWVAGPRFWEAFSKWDKLLNSEKVKTKIYG